MCIYEAETETETRKMVETEIETETRKRVKTETESLADLCSAAPYERSKID